MEDTPSVHQLKPVDSIDYKDQCQKRKEQAFFSFDTVKSQFFESLEFIDVEYHRRHMERRRNQLTMQLLDQNLSAELKQKFQRIHWVLTGLLDHNMSIKKLFKISKTYERLKLVPKDYMYAELYLQHEQPYHQKKLQGRIDAFNE